jgi:hypothetical protein
MANRNLLAHLQHRHSHLNEQPPHHIPPGPPHHTDGRTIKLTYGAGSNRRTLPGQCLVPPPLGIVPGPHRCVTDRVQLIRDTHG